MPSDMPFEFSEDYYEEIRQKFLKLGSPDSADAVVELFRIRDKLMQSNVLLPYYPRGTKRFLKFSRPEEYGNPFGGLLFSHALSDEDRIEVIEYFGKDPNTIPWISLGTRIQIIQACKATGIEVPAEVLASGCGNPACPDCGCN